ncbi:MAG: alpha-glucuronidase family glycosyl hydrolase [Anaerocolumna sp.]
MENRIVINKNAGDLIRIAASELRRYIYLLEGRLEEIVSESDAPQNQMVLGIKGSTEVERYVCEKEYDTLKPGGYIVKSFTAEPGNTLVFTGLNSIAVLYAVYAFLEGEGIRFYLHGDVLPDFYTGTDLFKRQVDIRENPLFDIRGILPFHDFPEGPDWWSREDYLGILTQLVKMRANFWGFHTYPESDKDPNGSTAEPLVWIGPPEECDEEGNVLKSYPAQHFKTNGNSWGYHSRGTEEYPFGLGQLFEKNYYCPDYMKGYEEVDYHGSKYDRQVLPEQYNRMFNQYGDWMKDIFKFAGKLQVKNCIGTETPLTVPEAVRRHMGSQEIQKEDIEKVYEGIFERIKRKYPIDYYWLWTPEKWTWEGNTKEETKAVMEDIRAAINAIEKREAGFSLSLCGWTLGPKEDKALFDRTLHRKIPFSCINQSVGFDPVDPAFKEIEDRPKWAIPWLEDDPALISEQLWVGRMRKDAYDATTYGCDGLIGIHWRTRAIAPNLKALMDAAWNQGGWNREISKQAAAEGYYGKSLIQKRCNGEGVFASERIGMEGYRLKVPAGEYQLLLYIPREVREKHTIFRVKVNQVWRCTADTALLPEELEPEILLEPILVGQDKILDIRFEALEGEVRLSGITVLGRTNQNQLGGKRYTRKINCGGEAFGDTERDLDEFTHDGRFARTDDFYASWAAAEFGGSIGAEAAAIFTEMDGRLPRPSSWVDGPGNIVKNPIPWEHMQEQYAFVSTFAALKDRVAGESQKQRFDYWLYQFRLLELTAKTGCLWWEVEAAVMRKEKDGALNAWGQLMAAICELEHCLLMTVETMGELGVLANIQQRSIMPIMDSCTALMKEIDVGFLNYQGLSIPECEKLIIPTIRTSLRRGEDLLLKVIIAGGLTGTARLYWRPMGEKVYHEKDLVHIRNWVYLAELSHDEIRSDLEYHIKVMGNGVQLAFPQSDLCKNQTVILI